MSIPQKVRASVAIAQSQQFAGPVPVKRLPRLLSALADDAGQIDVELMVSKIAGHATLKGQLSGTVQLRCCRCEQSYAVTLQLPMDLRLVSGEAEEKQALSECEPVVVTDDELQLHELIEDEALLGLPMLPRCDSCENSVRNAPATPAQNPQGERENPFAALKKLKF